MKNLYYLLFKKDVNLFTAISLRYRKIHIRLPILLFDQSLQLLSPSLLPAMLCVAYRCFYGKVWGIAEKLKGMKSHLVK